VSAVGEDVIIVVPAVKLVNGAGVRTSGVAYISVLLYAYWPIRNDVLVIGTDLMKHSRSDYSDCVAFGYERLYYSVLDLK